MTSKTAVVHSETVMATEREQLGLHPQDPTLDHEIGAKPTPKKKKRDRIKYTCPVCGTRLWAKPGVHVACMKCKKEFQSAQPEPD